jgi:hypothetical protein
MGRMRFIASSLMSRRSSDKLRLWWRMRLFSRTRLLLRMAAVQGAQSVYPGRISFLCDWLRQLLIDKDPVQIPPIEMRTAAKGRPSQEEVKRLDANLQPSVQVGRLRKLSISYCRCRSSSHQYAHIFQCVKLSLERLWIHGS